jgi:trans-2,3-dihydro-3-hydroxyanthranilate isomerase
MGLPFWIVDVFAEQQFAGNQLAVFWNAAALSTQTMQQIAKEINYSETTFILSQSQGGYDVRIFTPEQELPFAGHPTLGTAYVIKQEFLPMPVPQVVLNLKVGQIPVSLDATAEVLWMQQNPPTFGTVLPEIAAVLNLEPSAIDNRFPIQQVSTGVPFLIVPLKTLAALQQAKVNRELFFQLIESTDAKAILVFCPETRSPANQLSVRVFADGLGIPEDPATGSANGCLASYLVQHRYLERDQIDLRVEQGYEMGRPSLLLLKAQREAAAISVAVGGSVIPVARGEFMLR